MKLYNYKLMSTKAISIKVINDTELSGMQLELDFCIVKYVYTYIYNISVHIYLMVFSIDNCAALKFKMLYTLSLCKNYQPLFVISGIQSCISISTCNMAFGYRTSSYIWVIIIESPPFLSHLQLLYNNDRKYKMTQMITQHHSS